MLRSRLFIALPVYEICLKRWSLTVGLTLLLFITATPLRGAPGDLDTSFGTNGMVTIKMGPEYVGEYPYGIGLQSDGRIVLSCYANSTYGMVRYHSDGTLDTTFGTSGVFYPASLPYRPPAIAMAMQPDGKILQLGTRFGVTRHNANGDAELHFPAPALGHSDTSSTMTVGPNGRIVVGGYFQDQSTFNPRQDFGLVCYDNAGRFDSSFNFGERVGTDFGDELDRCSSIAFQDDEKIVAGGWGFLGWKLARYNRDGTLDTTFSGDGKLAFIPAPSAAASPVVAIQRDGKILMAGMASNQFAFVRFSSDGSPDTSFGSNGRTLLQPGDTYSGCGSMIIQRDGKIIAVGAAGDSSGGQVAIVRLRADGTPDASFGRNGIVVTKAGTNGSSASAVALQPDGKILVAVAIQNGTYGISGVLRYFGDSSPAITVQPTGQVVNVGANVGFTVAASGSSPLGYQWLHNGAPIVAATNSSLLLTNVQISDAGTYSVVVSNHVGIAQSSNAILRVNRVPIADASATVRLVITLNGSNSPVVLDGSRSSDPDGDRLTYRWLTTGDPQPIATGVVAIVTLPRGAHPITLEVSDGVATDSDLTTVEIVNVAEAIRRLLAQVEGSELSQGDQAPLQAHLRLAERFIQDARPSAGLIQLERFKSKVSGSVAQNQPELAQQWIAAADLISDALRSGGGSRLQRLVGVLAAADISDNTRSVLETSLLLNSANHGSGGPNIAQLNEFMVACESELGTSDPQLCRLLTENAREAVLELRGDALRVCPTLNWELNRIELRFFGFAGERYCIACSTNLVDWQLLGVAREIEANDFYFEDAELDGRRFYRLVTP